MMKKVREVVGIQAMARGTDAGAHVSAPGPRVSDGSAGPGADGTCWLLARPRPETGVVIDLNIVKWLKKKKNMRIQFRDIWKLYEIQVLVSVNKVYWHSQAHSLAHCVWPLWYSVRVEWLGHSPYSPQSWNYLLSGPVRELCWPLIETDFLRGNRCPPLPTYWKGQWNFSF